MSLRAAIGKRLPLILGVILVLIAIGLGTFIKQMMGDKKVEQKKVVQQITLVAPPPPPPPPPEPEPEPEVEEQPIEEPIDESMPDEPMDDSMSQDLGLDADGSAGGDGFGLVARKGGSGLIGGGSSYAVEIQTSITDLLSEDEELRHQGYQAVLKLWIDERGHLLRYEVQQREGDPKVKKLLQTALASIPPFQNPPPIEMPQPIRLRIKSQL
jgi:protein TonB